LRIAAVVFERPPAQALCLVRNLKLRRSGVTVEDERGNLVSFFQLKEMAELEARKNTSRT
jgi:hypothetical protein